MYRILELNPQLQPYAGDIDLRMAAYHRTKNRLLSTGISLKDFDCVRWPELRFAIHQQMNMFRHNLHGYNPGLQTVCNFLQMFFNFLFQPGNEDLFPVFRTPYDVVSERVNISSTMCNIFWDTKKTVFLHVKSIPYASDKCNKNRLTHD